ncbi:helix-turn-helix domain-containing protein [Amedibacterium intestinale]|uniref:helix-turn-helix domain-containing protein n=1 Tax=Amedibacterium intestinale TaxID=2583452 RepID=UPI003992C3C0
MATLTEINHIVGKAIREGMQRKNMTQQELANAVGSTQRSISSYVTGRTQPPLDILNNICKELEISMDQILLLPVYHHPSRIVSEKDEIEYISQLDGLSALKKKEFVQIVRQMRKLIK